MASAPLLLGLTGAMGAGKDEVARLALAELAERGEEATTVRVAGLLKEVVALLANVPVGAMEDREVKASSPPWFGGITVAGMLQALGRWGRDNVSPDLWVGPAMARVDAARLDGVHVVMPDVRYPNEVAAVAARGGGVWRVVRPDADRLPVVARDGRSANDVSETALADFAAPTLLNDAGLKELKDKVAGLVAGALAAARVAAAV